MGILKRVYASPGRALMASIVATILAGTGLLALPYAHFEPLSFFDLLFTATSATCVVGLQTVPLEQFTPFGQGVILSLIQIGGIGLITLTVFMLSLFINLGLSTRAMTIKIMELDSWHNIKKILVFIVSLTLLVETVGALFTFLSIRHLYPVGTALYFSLFHAISSFCNAGFSLSQNGLESFTSNYGFLLTTILMMVIGSISFVTWKELIEHYITARHKRKPRLSLHSKIVLGATISLIVFSVVMLWLLERYNAFYYQGTITSMINALFNGISYRGTGFTTVNMATLSQASLLLVMVLGFIGAAPGSTGSGIKITTFALFLATVKAAVTGRTSVELRGRRIPKDQVYKAIAVIFLSLSWVIVATFVLLVTEKSWGLSDVLLESISAFSNLGLSTGITPSLSALGKSIVMLTMFIGRIGSLTLVLALKTMIEPVKEFEYPEERVMLS